MVYPERFLRFLVNLYMEARGFGESRFFRLGGVAVVFFTSMAIESI